MDGNDDKNATTWKQKDTNKKEQIMITHLKGKIVDSCPGAK